MFSILNATRLAVMQVGVIVVGVLASGLWRRVTITDGLAMPAPAGLLYRYGVAGLLIPLGWLLFALLLRRSSSVPDGVKALAFILGIVMVIGLIVFVLYADVAPFFYLLWQPRGMDDDI